MVKVANKRKLKWCLLHYEVGNTTSKGRKPSRISQRRFQQIYKEYKTTKEIPSIEKDVSKPKKEIPDKYKTIIKQQYEKTLCGAVYLEKKLNITNDLHISHNVIHRVLLELVTLNMRSLNKNVENLGYATNKPTLHLGTYRLSLYQRWPVSLYYFR